MQRLLNLLEYSRREVWGTDYYPQAENDIAPSTSGRALELIAFLAVGPNLQLLGRAKARKRLAELGRTNRKICIQVGIPVSRDYIT